MLNQIMRWLKMGILNSISRCLENYTRVDITGSTTHIDGDSLITCSNCGNLIFLDGRCISCGMVIEKEIEKRKTIFENWSDE
jgi:hypothetical protein